jgi:hypothetical protein
MIATTTIGVAGGMAATGFCLGAGIWAFHWIRDMAGKAIVWVKEKFKSIKDILIDKIRHACDNIVLSIVEKYPNLNWSQQAQLKIAEIFCKLIYKTNHEQFIQFITEIKANNINKSNKQDNKVEEPIVEPIVLEYTTDAYGSVI